RTGRAAAAISAPRRSCTRPQTAIRCSWPVASTRPTRRSTKSSISISSATLAGRRHYGRAHCHAGASSVPAKTVPELIAYAKANPGKINIASGTVGGPGHVTAELFKMMTGTDMPLVSYRGGGPALTDLLAGQLQVSFITMPASIEHIRTGKLRALAVT